MVSCNLGCALDDLDDFSDPGDLVAIFFRVEDGEMFCGRGVAMSGWS